MTVQILLQYPAKSAKAVTETAKILVKCLSWAKPDKPVGIAPRLSVSLRWTHEQSLWILNMYHRECSAHKKCMGWGRTMEQAGVQTNTGKRVMQVGTMF